VLKRAYFTTIIYSLFYIDEHAINRR